MALPVAFSTRLPLMFTHVGYSMEELAEAGFAELGITGRDYVALAVLADDKPGSQLELAMACGKAPALVVGMVDELVAKELVQRERDPRDRRRSIVTLTDAGREVLAAADREAERVEAELLGALSDAEREQLSDLIRRGLGAAQPATA